MDYLEALKLKKAAVLLIRRIAHYSTAELDDARKALYDHAGECDDDDEYEDFVNGADLLLAFTGVVTKCQDIEHFNPGCKT